MPSPTVLRTLREAPLGVKAILAGVFVNRLSGFMNIFLVLFLTSRGYSPAEASLALGVYGAGALLGVFLGGSLAERLGARNATVLFTQLRHFPLPPFSPERDCGGRWIPVKRLVSRLSKNARSRTAGKPICPRPASAVSKG